ncbi:3-deoxy-manno-octulosonate cytidylyltransferase [hydrothermal vent metagenome]|uniref:3-deoxy-manno-octulosonate cytidylyltransferase n=1 Tax=hydrothermal vent metagenome TaxID=652676 RepID=A0A3B0WN76_9ZZZZ
MTLQHKIIGCIPARYASSRLPGKPLSNIAGKPMILHVVEKTKQCALLSDVVVLTDDQRIFDVVNNAGYSVAMTSENCASGTDRIAEFMQQSDAEIFVNIQGDEVTLDPNHIDQLVNKFIKQKNPQMGTLSHWCDDEAILSAPSNVKVVTSTNSNALYFSRNMIPVTQQGAFSGKGQIHIGVYIYTRETLKKLMQLQQTPLEQTEKLEQLRALENDIAINVTTLDDYQGLAVDTPEDLEKARQLFSNH